MGALTLLAVFVPLFIGLTVLAFGSIALLQRRGAR
jgi:hypothetical protein